MTDADDDSLRVSDADRQVVADRLRKAHDEGRLSLSEYDERVGQAYGAVTFADLKPLTADLPAAEVSTADATDAPARAGSRRVARRQRRTTAHRWWSWARISALLIGVWAATALPFDGPSHFWPLYPIGISGVVLLVSTVFRDHSNEHRDRGGEDHRRDDDRTGEDSG